MREFRAYRPQWVDAVLPHAHYRSFMLVMPFDLHPRFARNPVLESRALGLFVEALASHLRAVTDMR